MKKEWNIRLTICIMLISGILGLFGNIVTAQESIPSVEMTPSPTVEKTEEQESPTPSPTIEQDRRFDPSMRAVGIDLSFEAAIENNNLNNGRFSVIVRPANSNSIKTISVPIWSTSNQSDIIWYDAQKQSNGTFRVSFDYKNHQFNTGSYKVHVYAYAQNGQSLGQVVDNNVMVSHPQITGDLKVTDKNGKQTVYQASVQLNTSVKAVLFPTWTDEKGQDDIQWYPGSYNVAADKWTADIPLSNHADGGKTATHVYAETPGGLQIVTAKTYDLPRPTFTKTTVDTANAQNGKYVVRLSVDVPSGVKQLLVPIWSKSNQSDIVWYEAKKQTDGTYRVDFDYKNHQYNTGLYRVHAYVYAQNGQAAGTVVDNNVKITHPQITGDLKVTDKNGKQTVYQASVQLNTSVKAVLFPTWTNEKGQDDIQWYPGSYNVAADKWTADIPLSNHADGGKTATHVYAETPGGLQIVTAKTYDLPRPTFTKTTVDTANAQNGKFVVRLSVDVPSGVKQLLVPIWSKSNQSDIVWYEAKKQTDGTYRVDFDYKNHQYNTGLYRVHAYVYAQNGQAAGTVVDNDVKVTESALTATNFMATDISGNKTRYRISIQTSTNNRVTGITFPTWTDVNGQDDIRWYSASYNPQTKAWEVEVTLRQFHHNGTLFHIHAYADVQNKGLVGLGAIAVTVPESSISQYINHRGNHNNAPENSIPSFENSNYYGVETDIRLTSDNKWVIMHDETIDRMTNGSGYVSRMSFNQIRQYRIDAGNNVGAYTSNKRVIPTLEEYLAICKRKGKIPIIEIKTNQVSNAAYNDLVATISSYGYADTCYVISFYLEPLKVMKQKMPNLRTMYLTGEISGTTIAQAKSIGSKSGLNVIWNNVYSSGVSSAKANGLVTGAWTVPSSQFGNMRNMAVDYITTDN